MRGGRDGSRVVVVVEGRQGREGEGYGEASGGRRRRGGGDRPSVCFGRCGEAGEVEEEN